MQIITPKIRSQTHNQDKSLIKHQYINVQDDQSQLQFDDHKINDEHYQPSFYLKVFFSYLYFTQGVILSLTSTMPYVYPQLPTYDVMAVFHAASLPFSFKFLFAPLIQKFTFFNYGKRKTWIIISQISASFCLLGCSFVTDLSQSYKMAMLLFVSIAFVTLQDISLDSLAKKQLKHAHLVSSVGVTNQITGHIIGSMFLLKLTSQQFATSIHLKSPITNPALIIVIYSLLVFVPSVLIHFFFTQTRLKRQYETIKKQLGQIYCSYRAFFKWDSKYFRTIIFLLIMSQGFHFFYAGYEYQMIKQGFSRNTLNTIGNILAIPINVLSCYLTGHIEGFGIKKGLLIGMMIKLVINCYERIFFPLSLWQVVVTSFVGGMLHMWTYIIAVIFSFDFPNHQYTGMFITMIASFTNLGNSSAIHTKILSWVSWYTMSWVGIGIQFVIALFLFFYLYDWKQEGIIDLEQILDDDYSSSQYSSEYEDQSELQENYTKKNNIVSNNKNIKDQRHLK